MNKHNQMPGVFKARADKNGIAEAKIPLTSNSRVMQAIADKYLMKGDKNEVAYHEYYVTASYEGKIRGASQVNVNVANPAHKAKPKENSAIFPGTSGKNPRSDQEKKITHAYFVDLKGNPLTQVKVGDTVRVRIRTANMREERIQFVIWEYDLFSNDRIYESAAITIKGDSMDMPAVTITPALFNKGIDSKYTKDPDRERQQYFIEVLPLALKASSSKFGLADGAAKSLEVVRSAAMVKETKVPASSNCGGKYCIKKGDKNELIREINIRLAGFGGNVPTDEFTDRTEKMIKQFQRDYMKIPETGKVCGNVLRAIDEFQAKYPINFDEIKCKCGSCAGYGKERSSEQYQNTSVLEKYRKYEYPGIHRSLVCCYRASIFYVERDRNLNLKTKWVESGYRCHDHYIYKRDKTTNHCGKALDIHYNILSTGQRTKSNDDMNEIRKEIFMKYTGAKQDWNAGADIFYLESFATTWVHLDVREFSQQYLIKKYFVKNPAELNGKNLVALALELGFANTCGCLAGGNKSESVNSTSIESSCEAKFKKVAPIILVHEGGYKNEPTKDKGDPTNKGISWPVWLKYAKEDLGIEPTKENQKKITDDQATIIYRKRYWEPKGYCEIEDLKVALMIYDWSITSGGAVKEVQKLLKNEFEQNIDDDGGMGPLTVRAINNVEDQNKLLRRIADIRRAYYVKGVNEGWFSKDYSKGLDNRVTKCLNYEL